MSTAKTVPILMTAMETTLTAFILGIIGSKNLNFIHKIFYLISTLKAICQQVGFTLTTVNR